MDDTYIECKKTFPLQSTPTHLNNPCNEIDNWTTLAGVGWNRLESGGVEHKMSTHDWVF